MMDSNFLNPRHSSIPTAIEPVSVSTILTIIELLPLIFPDTRPLERLMVIILLLLKWWKQRPAQWQLELNYAWDLENCCPSSKPGTSLKVYLKKFANALAEFKWIDISDLPNTS